MSGDGGTMKTTVSWLVALSSGGCRDLKKSPQLLNGESKAVAESWIRRGVIRILVVFGDDPGLLLACVVCIIFFIRSPGYLFPGKFPQPVGYQAMRFHSGDPEFEAIPAGYFEGSGYPAIPDRTNGLEYQATALHPFSYKLYWI